MNRVIQHNVFRFPATEAQRDDSVIISAAPRMLQRRVLSQDGAEDANVMMAQWQRFNMFPESRI